MIDYCQSSTHSTHKKIDRLKRVWADIGKEIKYYNLCQKCVGLFKVKKLRIRKNAEITGIIVE